MPDNRKISLCTPTYNRFEMLFESFSKVYNDERISEIVIVDDASESDIFQKVFDKCLQYPKISLKRNLQNRDCYENKMTAISYASNDWVIILDSDNIIDTDYLDKIFAIPEWDEKVAYMPSWALPHFNYTKYEGVTFTKENISDYIDKPMVETCLNCMNYFVNRKNYLHVWQGDIDPHTCDSLYQNYNWMKSGNGIFIVPSLHYQHRVHDKSHYKLNNHLSGNLSEEIKHKVRELK